MTIQQSWEENPEALPTSHTCSFALDLPKYKTFDACKKKLLMAITSSVSIDTDGSMNRRRGHLGLIAPLDACALAPRWSRRLDSDSGPRIS